MYKNTAGRGSAWLIFLRLLFTTSFSIFIAPGCSSDQSGVICVPKETKRCECDGEPAGVLTCNDDGTEWFECECVAPNTFDGKGDNESDLDADSDSDSDAVVVGESDESRPDEDTKDEEENTDLGGSDVVDPEGTQSDADEGTDIGTDVTPSDTRGIATDSFGDGGVSDDTSSDDLENGTDTTGGQVTDTGVENQADTNVGVSTDTETEPGVVDGGVPEDCAFDYAPASFSTYDGNDVLQAEVHFTYENGLMTAMTHTDEQQDISYTFYYENNRVTSIHKRHTLNGVATHKTVTVIYNGDGLPHQWDVETFADGAYSYGQVQLAFTDGKLTRYTRLACDEPGDCSSIDDVVSYEYSDGHITRLNRETASSYWTFSYNEDGSLTEREIYGIGAIGDDPLVKFMNFTYEGNRVVSQHWDDSMELRYFTREYTFADTGRLSETTLTESDTWPNWSTRFEWSEDAGSCAFVKSWYLIFDFFEFGITTQEIISRIYGYSVPTDAFY